MLIQAYYDFIQCFSGVGKVDDFIKCEDGNSSRKGDGGHTDKALKEIRTCLKHALCVKELSPDLPNVSSNFFNLFFSSISNNCLTLVSNMSLPKLAKI